MKHIKLLFLLLLVSGIGFGQNPWINEIHYDNTGGDINEGVEVAIPFGYTCAGTLQVIPYNGANGQNYTPQPIINPGTGTLVNGVEFIWVAISGLQNGAPDGLALVCNGSVIQFLSYEGSFTATNGPANGLVSTDIGVSENGTGATTVSLQLQGNGGQYSDFTWATNVTSTNGNINNGQTIETVDYCNLQNPVSGTLEVGEEFKIQGRVYQGGLTDITGGQAPGIEAWIGYSTTNATTTSDFATGWTWVAASFKQEVGNDDEYEVDLGLESLAAGNTYYFVSRFRVNSGQFKYGGFDVGGGNGEWDGTNDISGTLTVDAPVVDYYNLQFPGNGAIQLGDAYNVYAQVFESYPLFESPNEAGTSVAGSVAGIESWIGYSPTNAATSADFTSTDWVWVPTSYLGQASTNGSAPFNNDEYILDLGASITSPGLYYYVSRFRYNSGAYVYGGYNASGGNSWDGGTNVSGVLTVSALPCSEVMISEYHEGSSGNEKYLEIYNPSSNAIDLTGYILEKYTNASSTGDTTADNTLNLTGTINPYSILVFQHNMATLYTGSATGTTVCNFNGDDVIALRNPSNSIIDIIGAFGTSGFFAANVTLKRNANILAPNAIYTVSEWTSSPANDISDIGSHVNDCQTICGSTPVTWNGTWSNGTGPIASDSVILNADYNTTTNSFSACSLTLSPGINLTIAPNTFVEVYNNVTNNGRISIQNQGSFVQVDDTATYDDSGSSFTDAAVVDRETSFINEWYEYTYWSSPVANETFGNALFQSSIYRRFGFNAANFVDAQYETLNDNTLVAGAGIDDIDDNGDDWFLKASGDTMLPGYGYAATHSITAFIFGPNNYTYTFRGILNNGDVTVPVERNDTETGDTNWNLIGNPYPSAIDVDLFFAKNNFLSNPTNGKLDGAIYLWSQATLPSNTANGNEPLNFTANDYAVINGTAETVGGDGNLPTRYIPSGQGFFVTYSDSPGVTSGSVTFTNSMRVTGNNNQFFRLANNTTTDLDNKLWLNINTDNGLSNQTAIGYVPGATAANDGAYYDAKKNGAILASMSFYTVIPGDSKKLAIQGKSPSDLDLNETIHLGFLNSIDVPTIYTISVDHFQGDFLSNNTVYLKDNMSSTIHDLSTSDYSFTSEMGEFNNRFEIVFNNASLSTNNFILNENNLSIIELENDNVLFKTGSELTIKSVQIFDVLGRNLYSFKGNNTSETYNLSNLSKAPYIAKVELSNGQLISKKAIKR